MKTVAFLCSLLLTAVLLRGGVQGSSEEDNRIRGSRRRGGRDVQSRRLEKSVTKKKQRVKKEEEDGIVKKESRRIVVQYKNAQGKEDASKLAKHVYHDFSKDGLLAIEVDSDAEVALFDDENIEAIEEDGIWTEQGTLDEIVTDSSHLRRLQETIPYGIEMVQADQVTTGSNRVVVCIVDTGVAGKHPDLDYSRTQGANRNSFADGSWLKWNGDSRGHGTHVAGTVAAKAGNGLGVRGMGDIELFITRGLNNQGRAQESDVREAVEQCEDAGANIISLSLSGSSMTRAMKTIIDRLYTKGALIFAASGNQGSYKETFPASDEKVISVSALNEDESRWAGSNYGPWIELTAPGNRILSTGVDSRGNYVYSIYSGTSMATPHAAGAAAILWSHFPQCTNNQIRYALAYTSKDLGKKGCDDYFGYGMVQVKDAYDFLYEHPCKGAIWGVVESDGQCGTIDIKAFNLNFKINEDSGNDKPSSSGSSNVIWLPSPSNKKNGSW